jgi:hypothetical protein
MADQLAFLGWVRPPGHDLNTAAPVGGRLSATFSLTVSDADDPADKRTRPVAYDLVGPADVTGLTAGAVVRTYPSPGARSVEADKAVYAELAAPDLPWRYTLDRPRGKALKPWIVLLVGTSEEIEVEGEVARIQPSALDSHPLADSARLAHVELDPSGRSVARLISPRAMTPDRAHAAVIVPAFTAQGAPAWSTPASGPVELAAYYAWTFETKAGGDFEVIARRLHLAQAGPELGTARVEYGPIPTADPLPVTGALVAKAGTSPAPMPRALSADLRLLTKPRGTATHPVLGLPDLGISWAGDGTAPAAPGWREALQADYRARALAGLGERLAIVHQNLLAEQAGTIAGAYEEVSDRLRRLSAGLLASRSLWRRRVPTDRARRLAVLGPALPDVLTATGPVTAAMEHPERALDGSLFSSAAQRALRPRQPTVATDPPSADLGDTLPLAAAPPVPPRRSSANALHTDAFARPARRAPLDDVVAGAAPATSRLRTATTQLAAQLDRRHLDPDTGAFIDAKLSRVMTDMSASRPVPILPLLGLLDAGQRLPRDRARILASALDAPPDATDLATLARQVTRLPRDLITTAFDLDAAAAAISPAFDPTLPRPSIAERALANLVDNGQVLAAAPDGPIELAPDLALAAWRLLQDDEPEWLLPGFGELLEDTVVGLTTNPAFVDTFLLGLNAQLVGELRFRNYPLIPGWTPVRTFWDRANPSSGDTDDDIVGIHTWPTLSSFGDPSHQTPSASSADLVVLFNTSLFREYPGTVVSLVPVARTASGAPDWNAAQQPFDQRRMPSFLGQIATDRPFFGFDLDPALGVEHWVVLEETVSGRRFVNAGVKPALSARNGADLANETVSPPRRVMIRGDKLLAGLAP